MCENLAKNPMLCVLTFDCFRLNDHKNYFFFAWMVKQLGGPLLINNALSVRLNSLGFILISKQIRN